MRAWCPLATDDGDTALSSLCLETTIQKDPILTEVWRARDKFAAECGYDIHKMFERMREITKQWKGRVAGEKEVLGRRRPAKSSSRKTR